MLGFLGEEMQMGRLSMHAEAIFFSKWVVSNIAVKFKTVFFVRFARIFSKMWLVVGL